ncbi:transaldolase family protein [Bacillus tianshenii]|nr:transaldolase family protein [Bacillus tianshenii]
MEIYIDTANLNEIKSAAELLILDGVTTNPSILAKQAKVPKEILSEINALVDGKVWYQVVSEHADEMYQEAMDIVEVLDHPVIKLPMGPEALKACKALSRQKVETNITLVYSASQALLASKSGATYVSPYVGRMNDIGWSGYKLIEEIVTLFTAQGMATKVIGASLRSNQDIIEMGMLGAKAVTMPYRVLLQMLGHPMSDKGLTQFQKDWQGYQERLGE